MLRYVAFVWDDNNRLAQRTAAGLAAYTLRKTPDWRTTFAAPGIHVFHAGDTRKAFGPIPLAEERGVILGTLFQTSGLTDLAQTHSIRALGERASREICNGEGKPLVDRYWGRYVAFLIEPSSRTKWIVRSPGLSLPCLTTALDDVRVYFSHLKYCEALDFIRCTINWQHVGARLLSLSASGETGLNEIGELRGGECVRLGGTSIARRRLWHPLPNSVADEVTDLREATVGVRTLTSACVRSWGALQDRLLLSLSGGLDSSIVLSCLKGLPVISGVTCFNQYSEGSNTDEREYARLAATDAGTTLIEHRRLMNPTLEEAMATPLTAKPVDLFMSRETRVLERELARSNSARFVLDGVGGDQLYWQSNARLAVHDYLVRHGAGPTLLGIAVDAARIDRVLVWKLLYVSVRDRLLGRKPTVLAMRRKNRILVNSLATVDPLDCDAVSAPPWVPFGRRFQLHLLEAATEVQDTFDAADSPEHISPLLSQPLIELCLRIPTYIWTAYGIDRGVARIGFRGTTPEAILLRRSKGGIAPQTRRILLANGPAMRKLLLEGELLKRNIVDRAKVLEQLSGRPSGLLRGLVEIIRTVDAEIWAAKWIGFKPKDPGDLPQCGGAVSRSDTLR